ncbi:ribosomal protein L7/L12 [Actinoallomurus sp. CA-142502]|uniref:ribosomal protein L7/L12 n=1 Tax=Actinoallomurus sp. CA-142502 TaxID=3239885 RepID=UPI003D89B157
MTALELLACLFLVVGVIALLMGLARGGSRQATPGVYPPMALPADLQLRVRALLGENKPILAVKEVRQATGLGLADAKRLVDALKSGPLPEPAPYAPGGHGNVADRARHLRDAGDLPGAVSLVQTETGMSAADAERFVAALS